ncbi:MAG TPA: peptide chain release factor N(5)-glutamine methyltransferase [Chloroflexota bacterium]|nr:peptide chain release factor N(5)-glutamine methyltransferase [Chloroflexota bacterium]
MITVGEALRDAAEQLSLSGSESPRLEARWLVGHILQKTPTWLTVHHDDGLDLEQMSRLQSLLLRRHQGEPLPYVLEEAEFYGRRFFVDNRVLVPRPETELLVEKAIEFARGMSLRSSSPLRIVDVGTGSGVIAISVALEVPGAEVVATDVSERALDVAQINVEQHRVGRRVTLTRSNLLDHIQFPIDLLVANLPYVRTATILTLQPEVQCEPRLALDGGIDGFALYRRLFPRAGNLISPGGAAFFEIGDEQGYLAISEARRFFPGRDVELIHDLAGRDRIVAVLPRFSRAKVE